MCMHAKSVSLHESFKEEKFGKAITLVNVHQDLCLHLMYHILCASDV